MDKCQSYCFESYCASCRLFSISLIYVKSSILSSVWIGHNILWSFMSEDLVLIMTIIAVPFEQVY